MDFMVIIKRCCIYYISKLTMDHKTVTAIKRQVPFLIGGTITGTIMTFYLGFLLTIVVNSIMWYLLSHITYKLLWRKSGLTDQKILLRYFLTKIKWHKHPQTA